MIIEVEINGCELRINGESVGKTSIEKMHNCRDYAREHIDVKGRNTFYTILDGKIASMHDVSDKVAKNIIYILLGFKNVQV